jgi:hypothetical protein
MAGPLTPPAGTRFSTGEDIELLTGPSSAPNGAVTVNPAVDDDLDMKTIANAAGTTFWLTTGTHTLGTGQFGQIIPKAGNIYLGAPGAIINGKGLNRYFATGSAAGVTFRYLEVTGFVCPIDEFVANHDAATGWTFEYCQFHGNNGASIGLGIDSVLRHCWLHDNGQYGFSSYKAPVSDGAVNAISNVTIDYCEIARNGTLSDEYNPDGTPKHNGRNGAGKFWDTNGITVTNNWIHHSNFVSIWADTNNVACRIENNLIEEGVAEAIIYEISYNILIKNNTIRRNTIYSGKNFASRGDNFPIASVYLSEAGGDAAVSATYAQSSVEGNTFIDNWGDLTLWENADRFCNSPANTSNKIYKPFGHGATLGLCNNPNSKTLTVTLTSGSALFTVTAGTFESTDEGRDATGTGIPAGTKVDPPTTANDANGGYTDATHGRLNATATASGSVTMTLAAGGVNTNPGYMACRWHTQNIAVHDNTFFHNRAAVLAGYALPSGVVTGKIAIISQYGTYPAWSPYQAFAISDAITLNQNNQWSNNSYTGNYSWMVHDTGTTKTFAQWQATPYGQDPGSVFIPNVGRPITAMWSLTGSETRNVGTWAYSDTHVAPVIVERY